MGHQIIKQPDGRLAVFSSFTDTFVVMDATPDEIVKWFGDRAAESERDRTRTVLNHVLADNPRAAYAQFAHTWDEARRLNEDHGGDLHYVPPVKPAPKPTPPEPPRFQWKLYDGNEKRWSNEHTLEGVCPGCCCNGPIVCPDCGSRLHQEPVEGMTADGWETVHAEICQQEKEDDIGDPAETRDVTPSAEARKS
ncbi:hypothetical protein AB0R01_30390 [Streptomyces rochei]|uniref:hypothetical protein n=1 Tax=Streptomyces rochei TaxID=1928 RepID=UPI0034191B7E